MLCGLPTIISLKSQCGIGLGVLKYHQFNSVDRMFDILLHSQVLSISSHVCFVMGLEVLPYMEAYDLHFLHRACDL